MDILPPQTSNAANPAAVPVAASQTGTALASDFETFLQMLTAQARYQDPLEPIDSTEYASQLAQFSSVEQQVQSNELLSSLVAQMGSANMAQFAGWIGMEARTTAPVSFNGSPIEVFPNPSSVAEEVNLVVRDVDGNEVQRMPISVSPDPVEWAGVKDDGSPFPQGSYSFEIESIAQGEVIATSPGETYGRVIEAQQTGGQNNIILEGGSLVAAENVSALRLPE